MRRSALYYILVGAGLGLAVPVALRVASAVLETFNALPDAIWTVFDYVQLMLWPTPLLLVPVEEPGAPDLTSWGTVAIATLANVTVYAGLSGLVWAGVAKARVLLVLPLVIIGGIWYAVWRV